MFATIFWICVILGCAAAQSVENEDDIKRMVQELHEINFKMDTKLPEQMKNFLHAANMLQQEMDANFKTLFQKQQIDFKEFSDDIKSELARQITKNENWKNDINQQLERQDTQRQTELKELREENKNDMEQQRIMQKELKNELKLVNVKTLELKNISIEKFDLLESIQNNLQDLEKESKIQLETIQKILLDLQKQQQINQQTSLTNKTSEIHKDYSEHQVLSNNTEPYPTTCEQALNGGGTRGVYKLQLPQLNSEPFSVYCEEDPAGGDAWTIIQRRQDGSVDFYRDWSEYKKGFGNLNGEYFIGLELLHAMTNAMKNELWIELRDFENVTKYAKYSNFGIGNEKEAYVLNELGTYSGDANDSLSQHKGSKFSTKDVDNDIHPANCAEYYKGAWWYYLCYRSNLNGRYLKGRFAEKLAGQGITWAHWHGSQYSLKYTHMAIRPTKLP